MGTEKVFKILFAVGLILLSSSFVSAVPAAPSPTCRVTADISEVTFREAYYRGDDGRPCNAGGKTIPAAYLLRIRINSVSTVSDEGIRSCEELYPQGSETTLTVLGLNTAGNDSFEKNQVIEGYVHFSGDECGSGIYLTDYKIIEDMAVVTTRTSLTSTTTTTDPTTTTTAPTTTTTSLTTTTTEPTPEPQGFWTQILCFFTRLFGGSC